MVLSAELVIIIDDTYFLIEITVSFLLSSIFEKEGVQSDRIRSHSPKWSAKHFKAYESGIPSVQSVVSQVAVETKNMRVKCFQ